MTKATTIRAFERGLKIMQLLNRFNGLGIDAISKAASLPRPTTFRLLHTLMDIGYVVYRQDERQYRLTSKVRALSSGYQVRGWVTDIAMPIMDKHARAALWPLTLCVMNELVISVAYITDQRSQLIVQRVSTGVSIPMLSSAVGTVFLTFSDPNVAQRARIYAKESGEEDWAITPQAAADLERRIEICRTQHFSVHETNGSRALAVPIEVDGRLRAVLAIRSVSGAAWSHDEDAHYLAQLRNIAGAIATELKASEQTALPI